MSDVRTRFAPSPTGYMHVGGIRTALFAWLVARQAKGQFILRLEDTDQQREVKGAEDHLIQSLKALGLDYDEGPDKGGPFGPYKQSQRLEIYKKWANRLVDMGRAYADPYSPEEVQSFRDNDQKNKRAFLFRNYRPEKPPKWDGKQPLRFKSDPKVYSWHDEVMGDLKAGMEVVDDFVLIKSDDFPTYNFAHIIDDYEMQISHILRGQEFLASVPNYLNLYEALEFKPPLFATLPYVLTADGKKKLSKRDGAKDILEYINQGYLAEGLLSFIATLGWNDGTTQEVFSQAELIKKFSLSRVQKGGAHFDESRLAWVNGTIIRHLSIDELEKRAKQFWPPQAKEYEDSYKKQVLSSLQERLKYLSELQELSRFFFEDLPIKPDLIKNNKQLNKLSDEELKSLLSTSLDSLKQSDFSLNDLSQRLNLLLEATHQKPAVLFSLIRVATTQAVSSPGLSETLAVLGKDRSLKRMEAQIRAL